MDNNKKIEVITEMCNLINKYVDNYNLFCGGCCFAAYLIAKYLDMFGISYTTAIFQDGDILNVINFNKAINGDGVAHVAIEVKVNGEKMFIGDCGGIYDYYQCTNEKYYLRRYHRITPMMLLKGYKNNTWNYMYNTAYNSHLSREMKKIYLKYC